MNLKLVSSVGTSMSPSFTPKCPPTVFEFSVFPSSGGAKRYAVNGRQFFLLEGVQSALQLTEDKRVPQGRTAFLLLTCLALNSFCLKSVSTAFLFFRVSYRIIFICDLHDCSFVVGVVVLNN
jgi:hypothetical protein